jgi:integrase
VIFRLSSLRREKSGAFKARKGIPADVRAQYQALYGRPQARSKVAWEAIFYAPAGTPPQKAKTAHAEWLALVESRVAILRQQKLGAGVDLSQRQAAALAGEWYRWFVSQHEENPGECSHWAEQYDVWWNSLIDVAGDPETGEIDTQPPEVREELYPLLARGARTDKFLADRGTVLTEAGRDAFLSGVLWEFLAATKTLERRAGGDWGPDKHLNRLAPPARLAATTAQVDGREPSSPVMTGRSACPSAVQLFEAYSQDRKVKPSTIARQRVVFPALDAWLEAEGLTTVTLDNDAAQRWIDRVAAEGRAAKTIKDVWLAAPRAVFAWAKRKRKLRRTDNPFEGLTVEKHRPTVTRQKEFTEAETQTILRAALALRNIPSTHKGKLVQVEAARRWVPWLCAYTGARVGEMTQLRACDVERQACGPVVCITPEAGTVKNDKARTVPIHSHLVEQGFLEFVEVVRAQHGPEQPLFNTGKVGKGRGPAERAREDLATWVRDLGVTDKRIQPNHAWRHTWKRRAARARIEAGIRDAVCGHAPRTVADYYEQPTVEDMANALKHFPPYEVDSDCGNGSGRIV